MPPGMARVEVKFQVDADGILKVTAKEQTTGAEQTVTYALRYLDRGIAGVGLGGLEERFPPEPFEAAVDVRGFADVGEVARVVAEQLVARPGIPLLATGPPADRALGVRGMVQQVHVQVAVAVVIEEGGLGGVADVFSPSSFVRSENMPSPLLR